jgi:hypothetical protein
MQVLSVNDAYLTELHLCVRICSSNFDIFLDESQPFEQETRKPPIVFQTEAAILTVKCLLEDQGYEVQIHDVYGEICNDNLLSGTIENLLKCKPCKF